MRFLDLHAEHFGPLQDLHFELHGDVFVVVGHNEAGKSSFHAALESILYGFEASSRDRHPLAKFRSGEDLELRATVQLDDKSLLQVHRVLMTQGKLTIQNGEGRVIHTSNNNEALPAMQSVPRSLFQAVYSLTANDTDMQRDDVRGHIRELLLGETGLRGARPIATVRREVEQDMLALWREDSRGTPVAKELGKQLKQAKKDRRAAKQADRELRDAKRELEQLRPDLEANRKLLSALRNELNEHDFRVEWQAYLAKQAAVDLIDSRLVDGPAEWKQEVLSHPAQLESKLEDLTQQLRGPQERLAQSPKSLVPELARILEQEPAIETVLAQVGDRKDTLRALSVAERGLLDCTRAVDGGLKRLGADGHAVKKLGAVAVHGLQADADQWDADLERFAEDSERKGASRWWIAGALIGVAGVGAQAGQVGPIWAGLVAILIGFAWALSCFLRPTRSQVDMPRPGLPDRSAVLLSELGLPTASVRSPQVLTRIADQLEEAQQSLGEAHRHLQSKKEAQVRLEALEGDWKRLAGELGLSCNNLDSLPGELNLALKRAEKAEDDVQRDMRERETAQIQNEALQPQWQACQEKLHMARQLLSTAFPDLADMGHSFEAWNEIGRKRISAEEDLIRLQGRPLYHRLQNPNQPSVADATQSDAQELRRRIEELEATTGEQSVRIGALEERLASDRTAHLARAEETILEVESKLQETRENRDQLALLGQILRVAEARYRKANEPDVLQKAGEYLREISQGRYTALAYPSDDSGNADESCLQVLSSETGLCDVAKPLSRGTQEQIYLALRLGTLDYLDEGREKLPLILDEALVHWDQDRRASLYSVLKTVAKKRQVILFTCHESFAEEVEQAMGARLIQLPVRQ